MDVPLVSSQVIHIQGDLYESLETGKSLPPLISFDYVIFAIESPFVDPPRPLMVNCSLTKPP